MKRTKILQFCILFIFIFYSATHSLYVNGLYERTITSEYSGKLPRIWETINTYEWQDANKYLHIGHHGKFDLYLIHGNEEFFIGIRIKSGTDYEHDYCVIFFDEGDDGQYGSGSGDSVLTDKQEDRKSIIADGRVYDGYWRQDLEDFYVSGAGTAVDFIATMQHDGARLYVIFKVPFQGDDGAPDDLSDLNITPNDSIGFMILFWDDSERTFYSYPIGSNPKDPSTWCELRFENDFIFNIIFYSLIILISGISMYFLIKKLKKFRW